MIEVKGPGDRLQDHQIRWLEFLPVKVSPPVSATCVGKAMG